MQNGAFPWMSPSSIGSSPKPWPGYQASLTDLFLKKTPLHQFATSGISQLAAASSYLEKMSLSGPSVGPSLGSSAGPSVGPSVSVTSPGPTAGPSSASPSDILLTHSGTNSQKCPHADSKEKSYACQVCDQYSSLCPTKDTTTSCSSRMNPNSLEHKTSPFTGVPSPHHPHPAHVLPSSIPHHHHHHHHHQPHRRASVASAGSSSNMSRSRSSANKQFLCPVCHKLFTQKGILWV